MIIDFNNVEEQSLPNFKGGEKSYEARMSFDGMNRIMKGRLQPGASIGLHTHETSSEIIYVLKGKAQVVYDGETLNISEGQCHYCPKGHSHTFINNSNEEVEILAVVPEQ